MHKRMSNDHYLPFTRTHISQAVHVVTITKEFAGKLRRVNSDKETTRSIGHVTTLSALRSSKIKIVVIL